MASMFQNISAVPWSSFKSFGALRRNSTGELARSIHFKAGAFLEPTSSNHAIDPEPDLIHFGLLPYFLAVLFGQITANDFEWLKPEIRGGAS